MKNYRDKNVNPKTERFFEVPYKYCPNCLPSDHPRLQCRAQTMANQYPEKVKIIYECPCDDQKQKETSF